MRRLCQGSAFVPWSCGSDFNDSDPLTPLDDKEERLPKEPFLDLLSRFLSSGNSDQSNQATPK